MSTELLPTTARRQAIRDLIAAGGPVTSLYLHAESPADEPPEHDRTVRWHALRLALADAGAAPADLDLLSERVALMNPGDRVLATFAAHGRIWLSAELDDCDQPDVALVGPWPRVVPLLRWEQQRLPSVVAVLHHGMADLASYDGDDRQLVTERMAGPDDEIERNAPGGWSQSRYRRRAEDSWARNATAFARRITDLADDVRAELIVLTGDTRESHLVLQQLPARLQSMVTSAARPQQGSDGVARVRTEDRRALVRAAATRRRQQQLADFDEAVGTRSAVEGAADVRRALDAGAVRQLVVVHGAADDALADALVVAALDGDAEVVVAEDTDVTLVGGVGALLRF